MALVILQILNQRNKFRTIDCSPLITNIPYNRFGRARPGLAADFFFREGQLVIRIAMSYRNLIACTGCVFAACAVTTDFVSSATQCLGVNEFKKKLVQAVSAQFYYKL